MKKTAAAGTMQIVNKTEFSEMTTQTPLMGEQVKIGSLFHALDSLIILHKSKLEKLKQLKQAFLERMFV